MKDNNKQHKTSVERFFMIFIVLMICVMTASSFNIIKINPDKSKYPYSYISSSVRISDPYYGDHIGFSQKIRKDIRKLPKPLKKDIKKITIMRNDTYKTSYTQGNKIWLNPDEYEHDLVFHESLHVFDNTHKISQNPSFETVLDEDGYIIDDSLAEVYVSVMMFWTEHPKRMEKAFPKTTEYLKNTYNQKETKETEKS